jgi:hypothetical protein
LREEAVTVSSWTGREVLTAVSLYWICLTIGSALWVRRPGLEARQAAARAATTPVVSTGSDPRVLHLEYSAEVNMSRIALLVFAPPMLLVLAWLFLK